MNHQATIEKMRILKLHGMLRVFTASLETQLYGELSPAELVGHLIDAEYDERSNKKLGRLINQAGFRYKSGMEDLKYGKSRNLHKDIMLHLASCDWIRQGKSVVITGKTGTGKSFISCALGHKACIEGYKVKYTNCLKLFSQLKIAKADGSYMGELKKLTKTDLLIFDDFGLQVLDQASRLILLEILEDRYEKKSLILATQMPVDKWHDVIGDATIADAVCDRIIHQAVKIELEGDSLRKR